MRVKYPSAPIWSNHDSKKVIEPEGQLRVMEKDYLKYLSKNCRVTWKGGEVSGVVERIEDGLLFVDIGYGVAIQSITEIEETG